MEMVEKIIILVGIKKLRVYGQKTIEKMSDFLMFTATSLLI
jgi:hypothetical protein